MNIRSGTRIYGKRFGIAGRDTVYLLRVIDHLAREILFVKDVTFLVKVPRVLIDSPVVPKLGK